ncbi:MAG: glycoside hydrolase family 88 protein [Firmicutes bacterium]|nr:glycoside hydrolase family 88 protein [Bacillota bacterium]
MKKVFIIFTACTLALSCNSYAYKSKVGDVDNNRIRDEKDGAYILRYVTQNRDIESLYTLDIYDVNADGKADILDILALLRGESKEKEPIISLKDSERAEKMDGFINYIYKLENGDPSDGSKWNTESPNQFKWSYINGCMASAFLRLYEATGKTEYKTYADNYMYGFLNADGSFKSNVYNGSTLVKPNNFSLDDINSGKAVLELISYESSHSDAYVLLLKNTLYGTVLKGFDDYRTSEGNYFHKVKYPYQVWLDGTYMALPFALQYEYDINSGENIENVSADVTAQFKNIYAKLRNKDTGLYYHGYCSGNDPESGDYGKKSFNWASKNTEHPGCSQCVWLRGQAWYAMALIDCIELMEEGEDRQEIVKIYTELMDSVLEYRGENYMWRQVIDGKKEDANYFETSGSAGLSYALMKGYNLGILPESYYNAGLESFNAIVDNKLVLNSDGTYSLSDICRVAGLDDTGRDGSYNYYVNGTEIASNDAKGMAPLLLAYSEVLKHDTKY